MAVMAWGKPEACHHATVKHRATEAQNYTTGQQDVNV